MTYYNVVLPYLSFNVFNVVLGFFKPFFYPMLFVDIDGVALLQCCPGVSFNYNPFYFGHVFFQ